MRHLIEHRVWLVRSPLAPPPVPAAAAVLVDRYLEPAPLGLAAVLARAPLPAVLGLGAALPSPLLVGHGGESICRGRSRPSWSRPRYSLTLPSKTLQESPLVRPPDPTLRDAGFIVTTLLIVLLGIGVVLGVSWVQQRLAETALLRQQLLTRLERELPRELERLAARARASGAAPDRQLLRAQAFINLHARGRREMLELERERQHVKQLVRDRVDAREELARLTLEVRRARMWVEMLQHELDAMPGVRPVARHSTPTARRSAAARVG